MTENGSASAKLDEVYRERAYLIACLASRFPAAIARDPGEPEWPIIYIDTPAGQLSWHLSLRDLELFERVPEVNFGDPRATWDGHTTEKKYERIRALTLMPQGIDIGSLAKAILQRLQIGILQLPADVVEELKPWQGWTYQGPISGGDWPLHLRTQISADGGIQFEILGADRRRRYHQVLHP